MANVPVMSQDVSELYQIHISRIVVVPTSLCNVHIFQVPWVHSVAGAAAAGLSGIPYSWAALV